MPPKRKLAATKKINKEIVQPKRTKVALVKIHPSHRTQEGHVLTLGQGDTAQLGLGEDVFERKKPALVPFPEHITGTVIEAVAGGMHTVCLTSMGEVYTFGCNDDGALGRDTSEEGSEFSVARVNLSEKIIQVSCGDSHTAALTGTGGVFMWGTFRDANGPFGLTSRGTEKFPYKVHLKKTIVKISSGNDHLCMLTSEGQIYSVGSGEQGQLGRIAEIFSSRGGRKGTGILLEPAFVHCRRVRLHGKVLFDDVWCTSYGTFASMKGGGIYGWGLNNYHQLGMEDTSSHFMPDQVKSFSDIPVIDIKGGQHHTIALDSNGKVYSLGRTDYGRLGLGEGCKESYRPAQVMTLDGVEVVSIGGGSGMSVCATKDGDVHAWGMGSNHQLGTGEEDDEVLPVKMTSKQLATRCALTVSAGGQHTVILAEDK